MNSAVKKNKNFFKKSIDIIILLWYNNYRRKEISQPSENNADVV